jgi:uncharacterized protein (DUF433 family)
MMMEVKEEPIMLPIEIHDRGRGPELKGTRLTVYDIIPYRLNGYTPEQLVEVFTGYRELTAAHIAALYQYMDEHHDEVMAVHNKIEERIARGNPPEVEAKLAQNRIRIQEKLKEFRRAKQAEECDTPFVAEVEKRVTRP